MMIPVELPLTVPQLVPKQQVHKTEPRAIRILQVRAGTELGADSRLSKSLVQEKELIQRKRKIAGR